jgi:hypothetical protein
LKNLKSLALVLCVSTAVGMVSPVLAQDADDFAAKLAAAYGAAGYTLEFGPSTVDGDTYSYDGVTVSIPPTGTTPVEPFKIDTVLTFTGVAEQDDGSYFADSLTVPDVDFEADGNKVVAKDLSIDSIYVPATADEGFATVLQLFAGLNTGPISVTSAGKEVFSIASIASTTEFAPEQGTDALESLKTTATVSGIKADLSLVTEAEPRAMIDALGINTITGSAVETIDWTMADGRMNVSEASLTLDNLAKLNFKFDLSGYTPALFDQMMKSQAEMAALSEEERAAKEQQFGMEMLSKLSLSGLSIRYDDASLAGKLLDTFAKQQGATRADFVQGLKMIVPAMVAQSGSPALNDQVTAAATTFLDDPKSLEVSVNPGRTVGFMELMAGAQDPNALVDMLKVKVTANEAAQ